MSKIIPTAAKQTKAATAPNITNKAPQEPAVIIAQQIKLAFMSWYFGVLRAITYWPKMQTTKTQMPIRQGQQEVGQHSKAIESTALIC
jgi:hypothetical protein